MNDVEHVAEPNQLRRQVMRISSVLVDLGMLPVQDIRKLLKSAQEVMPVFDHVLKQIQKVLASGAGLWD
jgi:hypothetical protein